jgi:hypothetical protein
MKSRDFLLKKWRAMNQAYATGFDPLGSVITSLILAL